MLARKDETIIALSDALTLERKTSHHLRARITELEAKRVPDGWKLVPIEPTQEMIDAVIEEEFGMNGATHLSYRQLYKAMLSAAPEYKGE